MRVIKANFRQLPTRAAILTAIAAAGTSLLSGCASNIGGGSNSVVTVPTTKVHVSGAVFGGQQPVSGSTIQMYTVGTGGIASAATPLITPGAVTTNSSGQFDLTGQYSCAAATQVYLVASAGDAGSGNNTALTLMAALGPCSGLTPSTFININELTTVAATTALAPFMSSYTNIGAAGSNPTGLVNAFNTAQALVSTAAGQPESIAGFTLPVNEINTLGNILAACVNSTGPTSTGCTTLLAATGASETVGAGMAIAKSPAAPAIIALWSLPSGTPPFAPTLSARPSDFTIAMHYTGAELASPYGIAIDATGNAWVTNEGGSSIVKLPSPSPAFATTAYSAGGLLAPRGISIDRSGNVWVANTGGNNVVKLSSLGAVLSGSGYATGGISTPIAIANDSASNAWVANFAGNSITELAAAGTPSGASPISSSLNAPTSIALDTTGRVAVANSGSGTVCFFSNAAVFQECANDGTLFGATSVAVSATGNVAMAGSTTGPAVFGAFTLATNTGAVNSGSPVSGGGLTLPTAVAYDGGGTAWFANSNSISAFSGATALFGSAGLGSPSSPNGIAVDASGNVWTADSGDNSVTIFVGLATPVATPIAANVGP